MTLHFRRSAVFGFPSVKSYLFNMKPAIILHHHEIVLKGENRKYFEQTLMRNIRTALSGAGASFSLSGGYGKFLLVPDPDWDVGDMVVRLTRVFGLANICVGYETEQDVGTFCTVAAGILEGRRFETLRVDTRRVDKRFPLNSVEVNTRVGAHLCGKFGVRANLGNPDVTVSIEIADGRAYIYARKVPGAGGLPSGVSGRVVGLLSAGFDSPVACWRMMKRGCNVSFVHFHSMPYTTERSVDQVREIAKLLTTYQNHSKLFIVPFAEIQNDIVLKTEASFRILLYRRMMVRIAEKIARRERAEALVTGEAVGQVASQTLRNIRLIDGAATLPILRPLSGSDKEETIAASRLIGTHDISCAPYDDCCSFLAPRRPQTWADPEVLAAQEKLLDIGELLRVGLDGVTLEKYGAPGILQSEDAAESHD